jgi:hypothetical protein
LGGGGIHDILELKLAPDEHPYLTINIDVLKTAMRQVDNYLDIFL